MESPEGKGWRDQKHVGILGHVTTARDGYNYRTQWRPLAATMCKRGRTRKGAIRDTMRQLLSLGDQLQVQ